MINYVIATYNGMCKRKHKSPLPQNVLRCHLEKLVSLQHTLSQITIMKAESENYYKDYYTIESILTKFTIPVKQIECENYGYSMGQWLKSYELHKNEFEYFLFVEDDYCPNIDNFDKLLVDSYTRKFPKNIGLLCSLVQGSKQYRQTGGYPIHWEGSVFVNKNTLDKLYNDPQWNYNPRKYLDLIDSSIDDGYDWKKQKNRYMGGYYQLSFSHIFTLSNIEHEDYLDIDYHQNKLKFPYWKDLNNEIGGKLCFYKKGDIIERNYTIDDIFNSPIIPIQLYNIASIQLNTYIDTFPSEIYPKRMCLDIVDHFKEIVKDKIVCDVGCGSGDILEYLRLRKMCKQVKGFEINKARYNVSRPYILFGDVFKRGLPDADVYILWLGSNFPYEKLLAMMKKDAIILYLDSTESNHTEFQKLDNVKLIQKIYFTYDEHKFINPKNTNSYIELFNKRYRHFKITGKRFFGVYQYTYVNHEN